MNEYQDALLALSTLIEQFSETQAAASNALMALEAEGEFASEKWKSVDELHDLIVKVVDMFPDLDS